MSKDILKQFSKLKIAITPSLIKSLKSMVMQFEIRKDHPLVLNSPYPGVNKISFTTHDRGMMFDLLGIYEIDVNAIVKGIPAINNDFKVQSDAFNLICIYTVHLILKSKLSRKDKEQGATAVLLYWQYRFFSSLVTRYYKHGAHTDVMQQVIEDLSLKFDIKKYGTWKKVFQLKAATLLDPKSLHGKTFIKFDVDKEVLYSITDVQTRLRSQLKKITALYYDLKETSDTFIQTTSSTTVVDGARILKEQSAGFESISNHIYMKMLHKQAFLNPKYVEMILATQKTINKGIVNRVIIAMSDVAVHQHDEGTDNKLIKRRDGTETYEGMALLVSNMVRVIYDNIITDKSVNINNKLEIYFATKNLFSTHRTNNDLLNNTKTSIQYFITSNRITQRENTISTLTISVALYICLLSFDFL